MVQKMARVIHVTLSEGDATVSQLAEPYRMTLQAVYKHLRVSRTPGSSAGRADRSPGRCAWRSRPST